MDPNTAFPQTQLATLDFARDIERLTADFTGREWVFAAVQGWLADPAGPRLFLLTGEPGAGKSAIAARLAQTQPAAVAHHFCIAGRNATITPGAALRSLAAQLGRTLPGYGEALANTVKPIHLSVNVQILVGQLNAGQVVGVVIEHLHAADPQQELDILLTAPLAALDSPPPRALIIVDALDEAVTFRGDPNLAALLAATADLPPWVRLLCTTRPDRRVLRYFDAGQPPGGPQTYELAAESEANLADIRQYVAGQLANADVAARLFEAGVPAQTLTERVAELSSGNFLYTRVLLDDIAAGRQPLDDLAKLPRGLDQIYHGFLIRFTVQEWDTTYRPILGVLAVAAQPLTEGQIREFSGLGPTQTRQSLGVVGQFLDTGLTAEGEKAFTLFHRSLRDYLLDEGRSGDFWCAAEDGHRSIADHYLADCRGRWNDCDDYGLRHLIEHLYALRQHPADRRRLFEAIELAFMSAKHERFGSDVSFVQDVLQAIAAAQEARDLVQEIRCGLIYSTLAEITADVPPGLLAALARTGQVERARSLVTFRQPAAQVAAYRAIGMGLLQRGARADAHDALSQALAIAETLSDEPGRASALAELGEPFARAELTQRLLEAAHRLPSPAQQASVLAAIARAMAATGATIGLAETLDEALNLAATACDLPQRVKVQVRVAEAGALAGQKSRAASVATEALAGLAALASAMSQGDAAASAVGTLLCVGETEKAAQALQTARDMIAAASSGWDRAYARARLAQPLLEAGETAAADDLIAEASEDLRSAALAEPSETDREAMGALALGELLAALALRGRFDQALEIVRAVTGRFWRSIAARALALALAARGEAEQASIAADLIEMGAVRAQAWAGIIDAWLDADAADRASALLARALPLAEAPDQRPPVQAPGQEPLLARMLAAFACAMGSVHDQSRAADVAQDAWTTVEQGRRARLEGKGWSDELMEGWALSDAAVALAETGSLEQAFDLLHTLGDDDHPSALVRMMPALARAGQLARAADEIVRIKYPGWRREAEQAMARQMELVPPQPARMPEADQAALADWRSRLAEAFRQGRGSVFDMLSEGAPLLAAIDQGQTLWEVYQAVREVEAWWRPDQLQGGAAQSAG